MHTIQLLPQRAFRTNESHETMSLDPGAKSEAVFSIAVSLHATVRQELYVRSLLLLLS